MRGCTCMFLVNLVGVVPIFASDLQSDTIDKLVCRAVRQVESRSAPVRCCDDSGLDHIRGQLNQIGSELTASNGQLDLILRGRACAPTPIYAPGTVATAGYYCLAQDIEGTIVIDADGVMLDLNDYQVQASGDACIKIYRDRRDVIIKNGILVGSEETDGIAFNTDSTENTGGQSNVLIDNVTMLSCAAGINVRNTGLSNAPITYVDVRNCRIIGDPDPEAVPSGYGIVLYAAESAGSISGVSISDCFIANCVYGLYAEGEDYQISLVNVDNVLTQSVLAEGLYFSVVSDVTVSNSRIQSVTGMAESGRSCGICFYGGSRHVIYHCSVEDINFTGLEGLAAGIEVDETTGSQVIDNAVTGVISTDVARGIYMSTNSPTDCIIHKNVVTHVIGSSEANAIGIDWNCPVSGTAIATQNVVYMPGYTAYSGLPAEAVTSDYTDVGAWKNFYYPPAVEPPPA